MWTGASAQLWQFYIQLVEVEAAFEKTMKDDLQLRPIYHQLEERIEAHIFVAFSPIAARHAARTAQTAGGRPHAAGRARQARCRANARRKFPETEGRTLVMRRSTPSWGPSKSSWSSNSSSICRRNHRHASPRQQRRFPSHPTPVVETSAINPLILLTFSRQLRKLGYLRVLDCADILALAGIAIPPTETAVALIDSDGSPRAIGDGRRRYDHRGGAQESRRRGGSLKRRKIMADQTIAMRSRGSLV